MSRLTPTELAAWWGAGIATLVLGWDVYKWKTSGRPRIHVEVLPNRGIFNSPRHEGRTYVAVRVTNRGDRSTTITNLTGQWYRTLLHLLLQRTKWGFVVASPGITQPIPHRLDPGAFWDGIIDQNKELEEHARTGVLLCRVYLSHTSRPITKRIRRIEPAPRRT